MYGGREIVRVLAGVRWAKAQIEEGARKKRVSIADIDTRDKSERYGARKVHHFF